MAWPWKKKESFIDLTSMKKSGLLDRSMEIKRMQVSSETSSISSYPSSTAPPSSYPSSTKSSSNRASSDTSAGGFLNFLDNSPSISPTNITSTEPTSPYSFTPSYPSSSQTATPSSPEDTTSYNARLRMARRTKMAEFTQLKSKVEDIEYKLDKLLERLDQIERN